MEFRVKIKSLDILDLPRYKDHLLDLIIQVHATAAFRSAVMDRIEEVDKEIKRREECGSKSKPLQTPLSAQHFRSS